MVKCCRGPGLLCGKHRGFDRSWMKTQGQKEVKVMEQIEETVMERKNNGNP
jgi:hypothetical protein